LLNLDRFNFVLRFFAKEMKEEEVIDNVMRMVDALTEYRRKFRKEWLPSEERRNCYESTSRKFSIFLAKWPFESNNEELNEYYKRRLMNELRDLIGVSRVYNLDGYSLELKNYEAKEESIKGEIIVNKRKKLHKFPLEKIKFLREEFPELWEKQDKVIG